MKCDGCTLCCELLNVPWMNSPAGHVCKHCKNNGCEIYNKAPKDCLDFACAYSQMEKASINLRPDKCGVIFERISNKLFIGTINPKMKQLSTVLMKQISLFMKDGFSVILFNRVIKQVFIFAKDRSKESV